MKNKTDLHVTGGKYNEDDRTEDILEYKEDGWRMVATMKNRTDFHATSCVKYEDFKDNCN